MRFCSSSERMRQGLTKEIPRKEREPQVSKGGRVKTTSARIAQVKDQTRRDKMAV